MTHRDRFVAAMETKLGMPVLWGAKGPDAFDCSGSVTYSLLEAGGPDLKQTHNAQRLANETRPLRDDEAPLPGDLVFYGFGEQSVEHVAVYRHGGGVVSADGATSHITSLRMAMANPANRVRLHNDVKFRRDTPHVAVHRNTLVDTLDGVSL